MIFLIVLVMLFCFLLQIVCIIIQFICNQKTKKYLDYKRKCFLEESERKTIKKMNEDIEKYGFVTRKGQRL